MRAIIWTQLLPAGGGNGTQGGVGPPDATDTNATDTEAIWNYWDQIYTYMYSDSDGNPRIRYGAANHGFTVPVCVYWNLPVILCTGTDAESTASQLKSATKLGISQVGFWTFNTPNAGMDKVITDWMSA